LAPEAAGLDEQVVGLRTQGRSFAAIARTLGLEGARQAHEAFSGALRRRPAPERAELREAESVRLEALAESTRAREDLTPEQVNKRLRTIERLRQTVMMD
jgi:hypothetical protein